MIVEPNRGAQVADPTVDEARQVFEVALAARAARRGARRRPGDQGRRRRAPPPPQGGADGARRGRPAPGDRAVGAFHIRIAEIAEHQILDGFIRELTSRSSLVVALYWHRPDAICERHAHTALVDAIAGGEAERAADLMRSHLVDLLSGLDFSRQPPQPRNLAALLGPR